MREIHKNIFTCTDGWIVIPINRDVNVKTPGKPVAIMGRGLAAQADKNFRHLPCMLGEMLVRKNVNIYCFDYGGAKIICLPTKNSWVDKTASLTLIRLGCIRLLDVATSLYPQKFYLPRLGCGKGTGNLDWEKDVKPVMDAVFYNDEQFILVSWP